MLRPNRHQQLSIFTAAIAVVSGASLIYIAIAQPDYLRHSREGTPWFTPPVENPDGGEPIEIDELIRHYKSQGQARIRTRYDHHRRA